MSNLLLKERRTRSLLLTTAAEMTAMAAGAVAADGGLAFLKSTAGAAIIGLVVHRERQAREAAEAALERERVAAAAGLAEQAEEAQQDALYRERVRDHEERLRADSARREATEQAEEARREAIGQERIRAHGERTREWTELNRDYPIPDHLEGFVTGIGILDYADGEAAAERFVNIGIIGESGTGKSSLIRELLTNFGPNVGSDQDEVPLINFESEGTTAPTSFVIPGFNDRVRLWDLPGQGTERFPAASYLRDTGLKYFDALLIATDGRWKTNDSTLLDAIGAAGIWFKVVRTKIDLAVESGAYDHGMSQEMALERAKASLQGQLVNITHPTVINLVTTRRCYWMGAHGGAPYGNISTLCNEVKELIEQCTANDIYAGAPMAEVIPNQDDDFEVVE